MDNDRGGSAALIQCTDSKRDEPAPARDLYDTSSYFRKMRRWVDLKADEWYILSAKHGIVQPDVVLDPFSGMRIGERQSELETRIHALENQSLC